MTYEAKYLALPEGPGFVRRFDVCDDFTHAVEQADDAREDGEQLVAVYPAPAPTPILPPNHWANH